MGTGTLNIQELCHCWYDKEIKYLNKIQTSKAQLPRTALSDTESFKLAVLGNHSNSDCSLKSNPLKGKSTGPDPAPSQIPFFFFPHFKLLLILTPHLELPGKD